MKAYAEMSLGWQMRDKLRWVREYGHTAAKACMNYCLGEIAALESVQKELGKTLEGRLRLVKRVFKIAQRHETPRIQNLPDHIWETLSEENKKQWT